MDLNRALQLGAQAANHGVYMGQRGPPPILRPQGASQQKDSGLSPLEEFKAREAAEKMNKSARQKEYEALQTEHTRLTDRMHFCSKQDSRWWPEKAHCATQLAFIEQRLVLVDAQRKADLQQTDKFSKFSQALHSLLCNLPARTCLLSQIMQDKMVQKEWRELVLSRIIQKSAQVKDVLSQRVDFELYKDSEGRAAVRLAGEKGTTDSLSITGASALLPQVRPPFQGVAAQPQRGLSAMQQILMRGSPAAAGSSAGSAMPTSPMAGVMPPNMLAMMQQQPGSQLNAMNGVAVPGMAAAAAAAGGLQCQAILHSAMMPMAAVIPDLTPEEIVTVDMELLKSGGSERLRKLCLQCNVQEEQLRRRYAVSLDVGKIFVTHSCSQRAKLESMLFRLKPIRGIIGEAMAFCMDHAQQASVLAKVLIQSLQVPDLPIEVFLARFFLVSDVLFNTGAGVKGASKYRTSFQELLPDACEHLGRIWRPALGANGPVGDDAVRSVLNAWRSWDTFPSTFIGGLEALLLSPAPEPGSSLESVEAEVSDPALRKKFKGWCHDMEPAQVRQAAKMRGLSGPNLPTAACRLRFCHYETYWHSIEAEKQVADELQASEIAFQELAGDDTASLIGDALDDEDMSAVVEFENFVPSSRCRISLLLEKDRLEVAEELREGKRRKVEISSFSLSIDKPSIFAD